MSGEAHGNGASSRWFGGTGPTRFTLEALALTGLDEHVLLTLDTRTRRWCLPSVCVEGPQTAAERLCQAMRQSLGVEATPGNFAGVYHCPMACLLGVVFEVELPSRARPAPMTDQLLHAAWFRLSDPPMELSTRSWLIIQAYAGGRGVPFFVTHRGEFAVVEPQGLMLPAVPPDRGR